MKYQNQGVRNDKKQVLDKTCLFSFIQTFTVGFGISPNLLTLCMNYTQTLAGLTASRELHPALRTDLL